MKEFTQLFQYSPENWTLFIDTMVYGDKPSYTSAMKTLKKLSDIAINAISN
ncbi:hypothetical protein [Facilibium subflavum]|uniref:hypothetical protein n=1 Tax=Facilibium subflavum TaxID=2219058 RepID=UPI0013C32812|nr:hypothetical protein [Facilibium subflavum]